MPLFRSARSIKPEVLNLPAATLCGLLKPPVTGEVLPATVCCPYVPAPSPAIPNSRLLLLVSRRDTFPVGDRLRLPIPTMVAVSDQPVASEPPDWTKLAVVGYRPVVVAVWAVEKLVEYAFGALKVATME